MKIPGIEVNAVDPTWRMRVRPWLNMKTLKPEYSVEIHHPEFKAWLAIYAAKRGLKRFKTDEAAKEFIAYLKDRQS